MKVLIVSKTRMYANLCIGGLTDDGQSVRLLTNKGEQQPLSTKYEIGHWWDIQYQSHPDTEPHVEDVYVQTAVYHGVENAIIEAITRRVKPWLGSPSNLFDRLLDLPKEGKRNAFITKSKGSPKQSTGFWLPDKELLLEQQGDKRFYIYEGTSAQLKIRYVGLLEPIAIIPNDTVVRLSLARWWKKSAEEEERCYLQLSGWYLR